MNNWPLMSAQELHAFGIEAILPYLSKHDGVRVDAVNPDPSRSPQIIGRRQGQLVYVYVRTAPYPGKGSLSAAEYLECRARAIRNGAVPCFASVGVACTHYPDHMPVSEEKDMSLPIRQAGFAVAYTGLEAMPAGDRETGEP